MVKHFEQLHNCYAQVSYQSLQLGLIHFCTCIYLHTRRAMYCTKMLIFGRFRANIFLQQKKNITYSECVFVVLVTQQQCACSLLYCHLWPVRLHSVFFTFSHKRHNFPNKKIIIEYKMYNIFIYRNWVVTRWQWLFYM